MRKKISQCKFKSKVTHCYQWDLKDSIRNDGADRWKVENQSHMLFEETEMSTIKCDMRKAVTSGSEMNITSLAH